jgi:hypothetical protein
VKRCGPAVLPQPAPDPLEGTLGSTERDTQVGQLIVPGLVGKSAVEQALAAPERAMKRGQVH